MSKLTRITDLIFLGLIAYEYLPPLIRKFRGK